MVNEERNRGFKYIKRFLFKKFKYPVLVNEKGNVIKFKWDDASNYMKKGFYAYRKVPGYGWTLYKINDQGKLLESNKYSGWLEIDEVLERGYEGWIIAEPRFRLKELR